MLEAYLLLEHTIQLDLLHLLSPTMIIAELKCVTWCMSLCHTEGCDSEIRMCQGQVNILESASKSGVCVTECCLYSLDIVY